MPNFQHLTHHDIKTPVKTIELDARDHFLQQMEQLGYKLTGAAKDLKVELTKMVGRKEDPKKPGTFADQPYIQAVTTGSYERA